MYSAVKNPQSKKLLNFYLFLFSVPAPLVTKWTRVSVNPYLMRGRVTTRLPEGNNLHFVTGQEYRLVTEKGKGNGGRWRDPSTRSPSLLRKLPQPDSSSSI